MDLTVPSAMFGEGTFFGSRIGRDTVAFKSICKESKMRSRCWRSSQKEKVKADLNQKKTNKSSA